MAKFISFKQLGNIGRFGNQLFQVAATISTATKFHVPYILPRWSYAKFFVGKFNQKNRRDICFDGQMKYFGTQYLPIKYNNKRYNLHGYFQSIKYFYGQKDIILSAFRFKDYIIKRASEYFSDASGRVGSIHIRRGDYLNLTEHYHQLASTDYYDRAIDICKCDKYLVFSDDLDWCKDKFNDSRFIVVGGDEVVDMAAMSMCGCNIIANSSFSWWAAFLGQSETVVMPKCWFGPKVNASTIDSPKGWIRI